jgi:hypothetical protein
MNLLFQNFQIPNLKVFTINQLEDVYRNHVNNLQNDINNFQERGSDFVFNRTMHRTLKFYEITSFKGGSYIPTSFPSKWIVNPTMSNGGN